ncbi:hypothetical protein BCL79_2925 [Stenotrophomonas rhizophila]|jgi:hypothetical protein|uniref:OLD protein-like TOPRIM domain-containing protein n=1 Tax=Stenotrophomonas rhizophila TaxID=216778 RepID=A0A498C7P1_9GAMM|nr:TOPRIM nucleotidyl transferase/hydrolase domain-containing protein [Stenotrophomonas rhizophila]RLK51782.1 hypothetical protein BCL79_2925 [Stenotrophomonas rhizophila]
MTTANDEVGGKLLILVEADSDRIIVEDILREIASVGDRVGVIACGGKQKVAERFAFLREQGQRVAALVDADQVSVADSVELARIQLRAECGPVFCAVPTIEAWLFADPQVPKMYARSKLARQTAERLPLPDLIPYPKYVARQIFKGGASVYPAGIASAIDLTVAAGRSPSFAAFVAGIFDELGIESKIREKSLSASISRDAISSIVRELPASSLVWKTVGGKALNAADLAIEISEGTPIGMQYSTELLRVSRDLIARSARKK